MLIKTVGIVGAGQMGGGIAHVASLTNHKVILQDISLTACEKAYLSFLKICKRALRRERLQR